MVPVLVRGHVVGNDDSGILLEEVLESFQIMPFTRESVQRYQRAILSRRTPFLSHMYDNLPHVCGLSVLFVVCAVYGSLFAGLAIGAIVGIAVKCVQMYYDSPPSIRWVWTPLEHYEGSLPLAIDHRWRSITRQYSEGVTFAIEELQLKGKPFEKLLMIVHGGVYLCISAWDESGTIV